MLPMKNIPDFVLKTSSVKALRFSFQFQIQPSERKLIIKKNKWIKLVCKRNLPLLSHWAFLMVFSSLAGFCTALF